MAEPTAVLPALLLRHPEAPRHQPTVQTWLPIWAEAQAAFGHEGPFTAAVAAALRADRVAWAFFAGYQGAMQAAFPDRLPFASPPRMAVMCANESGRKLTEIETRLEALAGGERAEGGAWRLVGTKSWSLVGLGEADVFVLAKRADGPPSGPGSLVVVHLAQSAHGVVQGEPRSQAFVPELPHAALHFNDVPVSAQQIVPGDGYADHIKPFRLREDVFVSGCVLAHLLAHGHRMAWPSPWRQRCVAAVTLLGQCAALPPAEERAIVLTAGAASFAAEVFDEAEGLWSPADAEIAARWRRDKPLLAGGRDARRQRAVKAWAQVDASGAA
jgi:hypothetical protein